MRIRALVIRIIRQFFRDKRTLGLIIGAPIFILWLVSLVFSGKGFEPSIGLVTDNEFETVAFHESYRYVNEEDALKALLTKEIHGYLNFQHSPPTIVVEGSDPSINYAVIHDIMQQLQQVTATHTIQPEIIYYYGSNDLTTFDNIGPFLIGFFVFFFVFIIAGVSFLRERTSGTLEKLLSTPIKRWEIVVGYVVGFGIFTTVQTAIIVYFSLEVLGLEMVGSIWLVMLITLCIAITALTLGTLLSAFASNELQMIQFIPIVITPQVFFCGLFTIEDLSPLLQPLSIVMPLTYGGRAMQDVMIRGKVFSDISLEILVLILFSIVFMFLNNLALRKHRKI